jgi:tRNA A-37 threonylcarbamoyl transferase component Bud32
MLGSMMLGQYELTDVLGQGGMSVVFKGRHNLTNQEVALKILPPELAAHSQVKSRFVEEARALAALDHPNIVHLYNFGQEDGYFVLAMQLVHGQTWERMILAAKRLEWVASCRIAIDVLRALEYAHDRGIVHRDMKPSNVLVRSRDSVATVMDFGIAKMTTSTRLTETGQTMGTVRYMSPEQVRGQEVDLRTDIYSLGATLYESLVGDTPFDGNTHFEIMTKHLSEVPRRPSKLGVELPAEVEAAVMRSLSKRPDDRFGSAREMRKLLEGVLRDGDVGLIETQRLDRDQLGELRAGATAQPSSEPPPLEAASDMRTQLRPHRRTPWLAIALAALVGGGALTTALVRRTGGYHATVAIAGVTLTQGATIGKLAVETDGAIAPAELASLYSQTLGALRSFAQGNGIDAATEITDPIDVLLAVPAAALCEPTAYLDHQVPANCTAARSATAIGARGTRRLMVVSDRAQLVLALRHGVADAACDFSPVKDDKRIGKLCDVAARFAALAEAAN